MKVTLISSWYDAYGEAKFGDRLGILYLAAFLEKNNIQVEVIDALWDDLSLDDLGQMIGKSKPDVVGVSCYVGSRFQDFKVIKTAKKVNPNIITVMGGPQATVTAEDTLKNLPELDFIVLGEGELTLLELCKNLEEGKTLDSIQGIAYVKDNRFIQTPLRPFVKKLDILPFPARHLHPKFKSLDPSRMFFFDNEVGIYNEKFSTVQVMASRGCPYNCLFCSSTPFWRYQTRFRSVGNVVEELELLKDSYGVTAINFADDTFNIDLKYLSSLCDLMLEKKLGFSWRCNFRANANVTKDLLTKMKEAGCTVIRMGVESGSPRILKEVKKGVTKEKVREIVKWCGEIGLGRRLNFIINFPGETLEEAKTTVAFAKEFGEPFLVNPLVIYPGTRIEKIAKENGCLPKDFSWADSNPRLKYALPGRVTDIPMFIDKIPFQKITDLIFQIESDRKKIFSLSKRVKQVLRNVNSPEDFFKLFSLSNFIFLFTYIKFRILKFFRMKSNKHEKTENSRGGSSS